MKVALMVVVVALSGCVAYTDPGLGTAPCAERCSMGCCLGDPAKETTLCVVPEQQDDGACGGQAKECMQCGTYTNDKGTHRTICAYQLDYDVMNCVLAQ